MRRFSSLNSSLLDILEMQQVLVVLEAGHFEELAFAIALQRHRNRPGTREHYGIVHCRLILNSVVADWRKALDDGGGVADDVPNLIEPRLAVEIGRFYDQRIALPPAARVTLP